MLSGYVINGNVVGTGSDTLGFGGAANANFNLSNIGASAQYQGFSTFIKTGTGAWTLTGATSAPGAWSINQGTLEVDGTIGNAASVTVNAGGTLSGTGSIATALTIHSGGTFAPGPVGGIGTFNITGSLVFQSAAMYMISVNGAGAAGKAAVTGTATLGGATVEIASGSTVTAGTKYTILTDTGGGLGGANTFNNANVSFGIYKGTLSYDADDVFITFALTSLLPLLPPGAPANDLAVANTIDNFIAGGGTPPAGFTNLFNFSGAQLQAALTKLTGEDNTGARIGAFKLMTEFLEIVLGDNGRGNPGGGLPFAVNEQTELPPDIALAYDAILKAPPKAAFDQRWSVWAAGFGGTSITDGNAAVGSNTVTATTFGSAAGMEYRPDPNNRLGFALAGSGLNWGLAQGLGTGRSDAFQAAVYGKTYLGAAYLEGAAAFGNNWFSTNRTAAFGDQLTATFTGQSYALRGEAGYRYAVPMSGALIGVTPYGALQTQWFHTPAYSEADLSGGGFALSYNANTANDTRSELGTRFDDLTVWSNKPLMLRARLAWAHDWTTGTGLNAAFQTLPGSAFTVNGAAVPHDSALTSASAQYFFTPVLSFTARFDGEFAPTSQTYAGTGTLKYTW